MLELLEVIINTKPHMIKYTNTFELLYSSVQTFHLHGDVQNKIVLGVNPDNSDVLETIDVS